MLIPTVHSSLNSLSVRLLRVSAWLRTGSFPRNLTVPPPPPVALPRFGLCSDDCAFTSGCLWEPAISVLGADKAEAQQLIPQGVTVKVSPS